SSPTNPALPRFHGASVGARSRNRAGSRCSKRSGGSKTCASAEISSYVPMSPYLDAEWLRGSQDVSRLLVGQLVHLRGVPPHDPLDLAGRAPGALEDLPAQLVVNGPAAGGVREVGAPHDVADAYVVTLRETELVDDVDDRHVAAEVLARQERERPFPAVAQHRLVEPLEVVRNPAGVALG